MTQRQPLFSSIPNFNPQNAPKRPMDQRFTALEQGKLTAQSIRLRMTGTLTQLQTRLAHVPQNPALKPSAVLIPLMQRSEGLTILLTQRSTKLRKHSGQIALPGGKIDPEDVSAAATALREAQEEIGLPASHAQVIGALTRHETGTGFEITPIVALVNPDFTPVLSADEVSAIFEVPLSHLMNPLHHDHHELTWADENGSYTRDWYGMPSNDLDGNDRFIWGVTARVLRDFYEFLHGDLRTHTRR